MRVFAGIVASLVVATLALAGCAPEPRNVSCSNDGQCSALGEDFRYCLESRCVACVGSASCGPNRSCVDGACRTQ